MGENEVIQYYASKIYNDSLKVLKNKCAGEQLYLIALALYVINAFSETTMFDRWLFLIRIIKYLPVALIAVKMIFFDRYSFEEFVLTCAVLMLGVLSILKVGAAGQFVFYWLFFLVSAKNVDFEKILKVYLIVTITGVVVTCAAESLDLLRKFETYRVTDSGRYLRKAIGYYYVTFGPAHYFCIFNVAFYLFRKRFNILWAVAGLIFTKYVYGLTYARTGCIAMTLVCVGYTLIKLSERHGLKERYHGVRKRKLYPECLFMPIMAVVSILVTWLYDPENEVLSRLDFILSHRLILGQQAIKNYGFSLLGQRSVEFVGFGGSLKTLYNPNYNFVDNFYLNIAIKYGIVVSGFIIAAYVVTCFKYRYDRYFILSVCALALLLVFEIHKSEYGFMIFMTGLVAKKSNIVSERQNQEYNIGGKTRWIMLNM